MVKAIRLCGLMLTLLLMTGSMQGTLLAAQKAQPIESSRTEKSTVGTEQAQSGQKAAPAGQKAVPAGQKTAPTGQKAAPADQKAAPAGQDIKAVFEKKVEELEKEYGVMKAGEQPCKVDAKEFFTSMEPPFDEKSDGGILFSDIRDYDHDSIPELLVVHRKRGTASLMQEGTAFDSEMYEYFFEMYEADGNECQRSAATSICVFDVLNWSINFKNLTVFLNETEQAVDICVETFISQQDHPSDTALVRMRYKGGQFTDVGAVRYGYWYSENGVRCMEPVSEEALNYLSDIFPSEETFWKDLASTESEKDERYVKAMDKSMQALGLKIVKTRQDIIEESDASEMDDAQMARMNASFDAISAMDCYEAVDGRMTMLAFLHEYVVSEMDDKGMITVNRTLDVE